MAFVCAIEEAVYERRLIEVLASLLVRNVQLEMYEDGVLASLSIQLVILRWPFRDLRF